MWRRAEDLRVESAVDAERFIEDVGIKTEVRDQRSEVRGQKSEVRSQKSEYKSLDVCRAAHDLSAGFLAINNKHRTKNQQQTPDSQLTSLGFFLSGCTSDSNC
jgi:hypothetical protein